MTVKEFSKKYDIPYERVRKALKKWHVIGINSPPTYKEVDMCNAVMNYYRGKEHTYTQLAKLSNIYWESVSRYFRGEMDEDQ